MSLLTRMNPQMNISKRGTESSTYKLAVNDAVKTCKKSSTYLHTPLLFYAQLQNPDLWLTSLTAQLAVRQDPYPNMHEHYAFGHTRA